MITLFILVKIQWTTSFWKINCAAWNCYRMHKMCVANLYVVEPHLMNTHNMMDNSESPNCDLPFTWYCMADSFCSPSCMQTIANDLVHSKVAYPQVTICCSIFPTSPICIHNQFFFATIPHTKYLYLTHDIYISWAGIRFTAHRVEFENLETCREAWGTE